MHCSYFRDDRIPHDEQSGESRVGENRMHDLVGEICLIRRNPLCLRRFTLIELLIVISIIAILAAMLLPVLNKVRTKARSAYCIANEKQILLAILRYTDDYSDYVPPGRLSTADGSVGLPWPYIISNNCGYLPPVRPLPGVADRKGVFICPDQRAFIATQTDSMVLRYYTSYGVPFANINALFGGGTDGTPPKKLAVLKSPSGASIILEGNNVVFKIVPAFNTLLGNHPANKNGNLGYADGHVQSFANCDKLMTQWQTGGQTRYPFGLEYR